MVTYPSKQVFVFILQTFETVLQVCDAFEAFFVAAFVLDDTLQKYTEFLVSFQLLLFLFENLVLYVEILFKIFNRFYLYLNRCLFTIK